MLGNKIINLKMLCLCFFLCFFAPMTVKAGETITGGETFETATEIAWDKEYTTTNDNGWFKIKVPENLMYIGAGYDEMTEIIGWSSDKSYFTNKIYIYKKTELGECTEYWDSVKNGSYKYFSNYYSQLNGNEYAYFHVLTQKAETCTFRLIYGAHYSSENRFRLSLNEEYYENYYQSYPHGGYWPLSSEYQFVSANTGKYKIILKSENGSSMCEVNYKDGTQLTSGGCKSNQTAEVVFPVTQGVTYYVRIWADDMQSNSSSPVNITFQVSNKQVSSISLNSTTLNLNKGEQFQLTATVAPDNAVDKTVTYSSSNPQVAVVSEDGIITAVCGGTATIAVDANDGSGVQAFCQVTVLPKLVTRLDLDQDYIEADLCACEKDGYQLKATAYPVDADNTEVTFTSSNSQIVSVDKATGMLTLKKPGTATITCITNDGSNLTKTCKVVLKRSHLLGEKKTINKIKYKVTSNTLGGGTVAVYGVSDKNAKSYSIPDSLTIDGYTYKITAVNDKAFTNCKKLTNVVLGANIKSIGKEAFSNCKKLKTLTIKSKKLKTVGKNAFRNIYSKATIKVPSSCLTKYKKLFKGKGQKSSVKIKRI